MNDDREDDDEVTRVLLVDDEVRVLEGLERQLTLDFDVRTAQSGFEALRILRDEGPFDVVVSDMRMPRMTGAVFFGRARELWPDVTRVLLTGYADAADAADAINRGAIFRYLNKPCDSDLLVETIEAAAVHTATYRAERSLLQDTLRGMVDLLSELLSFVDPDSFRGVPRVRQLASDMARELEFGDSWQLEIAAAIYPAGRILLGVTQDEAKPWLRAAELIQKIPRLDGVQRVLQAVPPGADPPEDGIELLSSHILRACVALERDERRLGDLDAAIAAGEEHMPRRIAEAARQVVVRRVGYHAVELPTPSLQADMILEQDVCAPSGAVLAARGQRITPLMAQRLAELSRGGQVPPAIRVLVPSDEQERAS